MSARLGVLSLVLAVALLLRTVLVPAIEIAGVGPDPVLLTVLALGLADGAGTGLRYGFAAGLAVDLLGGSALPVGTWSLALCLAGYGVGAMRVYLTGSALLGAIVAGTAAALVAIGSAGALALLLDVGGVTPAGLLRAAVGTALYDLPFIPVVVPLVAAVSRRWSGPAALPG